jgi:tripartite-type tricarboxylate transporter receptor subunit TctC
MRNHTSRQQTSLRAARGRRNWLSMAAMATISALSFGGFTTAAQAQDSFPNKPIRLVVPFTPGGVTDTSARVIAEYLGQRLGQNVIVDNKPGASGNIGTALVKSAAPDGYALVLGFDGTMVINPHVFPRLPFDTLKDFTPIGKIGDATLILVAHPDTPVKSLADVIAVSSAKRSSALPDLNAVLNDPAVRERLRVLGIDATPGSAEQFREEMRRDLARYGAVVKAAGISVE